MKENKLVELSMNFAIKIIKLCETIKGHYSLVNQLERSVASLDFCDDFVCQSDEYYTYNDYLYQLNKKKRTVK